MWRKDFLVGSIDGDDAERESLLGPPLLVPAAVRFRKLKLNCRLNDRDSCIVGLLEIMLLDDDALCKPVRGAASTVGRVPSISSSLGELVSRLLVSSP